MVVTFPNGAVNMAVELVVSAELRKLVGKGDEDDVLDPFPIDAVGLIVELPVGAELRSPDENGNEIVLVPLLKGAVNALVMLVAVEELVEPVGLGEIIVPLLEGEAMLVMLAEDIELVELLATAVLANRDNRPPIGPCRFLILRSETILPPQDSFGFPGHGIVHEPCPAVRMISDDNELAQ
jgi:hypothetical protein